MIRLSIKLCKIFVLFFFQPGIIFSSQYINKSEIQRIYHQHIEAYNTKTFKKRYVPLSLNKQQQKFWKDKDFPRLISTLEFADYVKKAFLFPDKSLIINGQNDPELQHIVCKKIVHINYLDNPKKFDLHLIDYPEKDFDFVMLNQTLEHVYNPVQCLENISNHMKSGGVIFINVPTINKLHDMPYNYYTGITPMGLGTILQSAGFEILKIGQWGNRKYLKKLFNQKTWPSLSDMKREKNPGLNEYNYPIITWAFAKKR